MPSIFADLSAADTTTEFPRSFAPAGSHLPPDLTSKPLKFPRATSLPSVLKSTVAELPSKRTPFTEGAAERTPETR